MQQLIRLIAPLVITTLLLPAQLTFCQSPKGSTSDMEEEARKVGDLIIAVRDSKYDPTKSVQAVPALKDAFATAPDEPTRENVASVLLALGQKDDKYWSVLFRRAQEIVESEAPYPLVYDASGKSVRGELSPEFLAWVKTQNLSRDEALQEQLGSLPAEFSLIASSGDPRGLPILKRGLSSPNYEIRGIAAQGLALLHDNGSIPLIIEMRPSGSV